MHILNQLKRRQVNMQEKNANNKKIDLTKFDFVTWNVDGYALLSTPFKGRLHLNKFFICAFIKTTETKNPTPSLL